MKNNDGFIYLLHFDSKYHHAQHYIGFAKDVNARMDKHLSGEGSKLIRAIIEAGITFKIAKVWAGNRKLERKLKKRKKSRLICPICRGEHSEQSSKERISEIASLPSPSEQEVQEHSAVRHRDQRLIGQDHTTSLSEYGSHKETHSERA